MFDKLVVPVLYWCEIWVIICPHYDSTPTKYLHLKFHKEILGLHSKTSNDSFRAELNRLSLRDRLLNLTCTYWQHLWSTHNSLVSKIVEISMSHNNWFIQMGSIFNTIVCFFYIFLTPQILTRTTNDVLSNVSLIYSFKSRVWELKTHKETE